MVLPRVHYHPVPQPADYTRLRQGVIWFLLGVCVLLVLCRLETPCNHQHKALNSLERAQAEFQANAYPHIAPLPADHDWCATKVRDISSWARAAPARPPFQFPKIIHQTVEDKLNISCEVLECMKTWKDLNPGYEHRLYDAADRRSFVSSHYPEVLPVYDALSTNVERADLWRYLALHRHGGVYADSDVRCMKPIREWNAANGHDADLLVGTVYTDQQGMVTRVNNFILAVTPCHPVMAAMPFTAMSRIAAAGLQGKPVGGETGKALTEAVIGRTGPAALTATIADFASRLGADWPVNGTAGAQGSGSGNLVGTVRLMPRGVMTMGWETAAEKISCDEALERNPGAYICHQYFGTWKATYSNRPALTYKPGCHYWDPKVAAAAEAALARRRSRQQAVDSDDDDDVPVDGEDDDDVPIKEMSRTRDASDDDNTSDDADEVGSLDPADEVFDATQRKQRDLAVDGDDADDDGVGQTSRDKEDM